RRRTQAGCASETGQRNSAQNWLFGTKSPPPFGGKYTYDWLLPPLDFPTTRGPRGRRDWSVRALATAQYTVSVSDLAEKIDVDLDLLTRLLRYCEATSFIAQVDDGSYQSNNVARSLHDPDQRKREGTARGALNLPVWLKSHQYKDPLGIMPTSWLSASGTDKSPYGWLGANPWAMSLA
ncbi:O-methyltransferase, partial [Apiospora marii]